MKEFYREIETVSIDPDKAKLIFGTFDSLENKELKTLTLSNLLQILDKINNDQTLAEQSNRPVKEIIIKIYMNILRANLFLREGSLEDKRSLLSYLKRNQTLLKQYYNEGYWDTFRKLTTIDPTKLSIMENEFGLSDDNELKSKRDSLNIKLNEIYSSYVQNEEGITEGRMHPWSEIDKLEKFTTVREILSWINDKNITSELMKQPNKEHFDTVIDMAMLRLRKIMATSDLNLTIEQRNQILEKLFELAKNNNSIFSKQEIGNGDFFGIIELMLFQGLTQDVYSAIKLGLLNFTSNVDTGQDGRKGLTYKFIKFMLTKVDDIRRKEILNALNKAYSDATSNEIVEFVMQAISSNIKNLGSNLEADEKKALALLFFEALMLRDKLTPVTSISMEQKSELSNILGNPIFLWDSRLSDKRLGKYNSLALKHLLYNIG